MSDALTDRELQSLRNMGNEAERAAAEITRLRADFSALQYALVGDTGASAIQTATRLRAALAQAPQAAPTVLNGIAASMFHDEGAYSQCGNCLRYSLDPKTISSGKAPTCECGESTCWSGSFKKPGPDAKWNGAAPQEPQR